MNVRKNGRHRVLVISPHPDDEAIGCGGTLRKHVLEGSRVHVVFLTSGEAGGHGRPPAETGALREREAQAAADVLGIERIEFYREPDGKLRATPGLVERLRTKLARWRPKRIYLPHGQETHEDHRAAARLLRRALAPAEAADLHPEVRLFEVWTPLQRMDEIVDISNHVETKRAAIQAYASQCAVMRLDEAILGLNRYRGEMHSWPGGDYAEVFAAMRR
jgi:LmbE family N-acetylglucosaminyl deacetylase